MPLAVPRKKTAPTVSTKKAPGDRWSPGASLALSSTLASQAACREKRAPKRYRGKSGQDVVYRQWNGNQEQPRKSVTPPLAYQIRMQPLLTFALTGRPLARTAVSDDGVG